jgi:enoyl-CoA hydratase
MNGISFRQDRSVAHIVLDRPERRNALNTPMLRELKARLDYCADPSVRVVTLTGTGQSFCAGGDLTGVDTGGAVGAANDVVQSIAALPKPVVAGVHGAAAGLGCTLALACDLVVAARSAFFVLAFVKVGLMPDGGTSALLPAAIGRVRAARMAMLGEKIAASTAFEWGMVSHLVDDDAYDSELATVADALASGPRVAYQNTKHAINASTLGALPAAQAAEAEGQAALTRTDDFRRLVRSYRDRKG